MIAALAKTHAHQIKEKAGIFQRLPLKLYLISNNFLFIFFFLPVIFGICYKFAFIISTYSLYCLTSSLFLGFNGKINPIPISDSYTHAPLLFGFLKSVPLPSANTTSTIRSVSIAISPNFTIIPLLPQLEKVFVKLRAFLCTAFNSYSLISIFSKLSHSGGKHCATFIPSDCSKGRSATFSVSSKIAVNPSHTQ